MRKAIAIDFDGCLCSFAFPEIGEPHWAVIEKAKQEQAAGAGLILWTCRSGDRLQEAIDAAAEWGLHFDAVNESLPEWIEDFKTDPRKVGASEYWDDRALTAGRFGVDPPRQPGRWLYDESPYTQGQCSQCGCSPLKRTMSSTPWNYCPNCGARMEMLK